MIKLFIRYKKTKWKNFLGGQVLAGVKHKYKFYENSFYSEQTSFLHHAANNSNIMSYSFNEQITISQPDLILPSPSFSSVFRLIIGRNSNPTNYSGFSILNLQDRISINLSGVPDI